MKDKISFTHSEMLRYVYNFDVIEKKYGILAKNLDQYEIALNYESIYKQCNLEKHPDMIDSASIIYGDSHKASQYSILYKKVLDKFILQYLGIPGLSSLYNQHYMDFEWNLHSDLDFENYTNRYYRDHFIHEIRNLFMMFRLFEDKYIYSCTKKCLFSSNNSAELKIGKYTFNQLEVWLKSIPKQQIELFKKLDISPEVYFQKYVIFGSSALACLFHDIGYPVAYHFSIRDRILDFIPTFHSLTSDCNFDFNYVNNILQESLLFQMVGKKEIQKRFDQNDHGAISAILLAIYFYKTGKIHSLPIEQRTAVELGILAIYHHTLMFGYCVDKKKRKKTPYYKMQFSLNPISYMLRLCDDAQEWEREYFEIKPIPNLLYCPKCKTPLRRTEVSYKKYLKDTHLPVFENLPFKELEEQKCYQYWCFCQTEPFLKKDDFIRRKLVNIKSCHEVIFWLEKKSIDGEEPYIEIEFKYDNFKLLRLCTLQLSFTQYRGKEMASLKKSVEKTSFVSGNKGYFWIFIKHNLTPNPMLLKMFILRDFLECLIHDFKSNKFIKKWGKINNTPEYESIAKEYQIILGYAPNQIVRQPSLLDCLSEKIVKLCYHMSSKALDVECIAIENCKSYLLLLLYERYILFKSNGVETLQKYIEKLFQGTSSFLSNLHLQIDDVRPKLCTEALHQIQKTYPSHDFNQIRTENYQTYLNSEPATYLHVESYCSNHNVLNQEKYKKENLLYYTDLYLYDFLNEATECIIRSNHVINQQIKS